MSEQDWLAQRFEEHRHRLRAVAYRMLGSVNEAEDAVQEAWLRLSGSEPGEIENLSGWLTTVVARVSLNMLRSRAVRREEPLSPHLPDPIVDRADGVAQREVVNAFLAAAREGDFDALVATLDPDVVVRADGGAAPAASVEVRGALNAARRAVMWSNVDLALYPALVNGAAGVVATRDGVVFTIVSIIVRNGKIAEMDFLADPERLARLDLTSLHGRG